MPPLLGSGFAHCAAWKRKRATHLDEANNLADRDRLALVAKGEPTQLRVVLERLDAHRLSSLDQRNDLQSATGLSFSHEFEREDKLLRRRKLTFMPFLAN